MPHIQVLSNSCWWRQNRTRMSSSSQLTSAATGENPESVERGTRGRMRGVTSRASRGRGRRSRGQEGLDPSEGWKVQREHSSVIHDQEGDLEAVENELAECQMLRRRLCRLDTVDLVLVFSIDAEAIHTCHLFRFFSYFSNKNASSDCIWGGLKEITLFCPILPDTATDVKPVCTLSPVFADTSNDWNCDESANAVCLDFFTVRKCCRSPG